MKKSGRFAALVALPVLVMSVAPQGRPRAADKQSRAAKLLAEKVDRKLDAAFKAELAKSQLGGALLESVKRPPLVTLGVLEADVDMKDAVDAGEEKILVNEDKVSAIVSASNPTELHLLKDGVRIYLVSHPDMNAVVARSLADAYSHALEATLERRRREAEAPKEEKPSQAQETEAAQAAYTRECLETYGQGPVDGKYCQDCCRMASAAHSDETGLDGCEAACEKDGQ